MAGLGDAPPYVKVLPAPIRRQLWAASDHDWRRVVLENGSVVVKNSIPDEIPDSEPEKAFEAPFMRHPGLESVAGAGRRPSRSILAAGNGEKPSGPPPVPTFQSAPPPRPEKPKKLKDVDTSTFKRVELPDVGPQSKQIPGSWRMR